MDLLSSLTFAASGAIFIAALAVALFFLRFYRASRERLFLMLSSGFFLLALERLVLLLQRLPFVPVHEETRHWVYVIRLIAFLLIILGVADKNRSRRAR